ncbi:galactose-1-phosphate uridylyltransferase [Acidimicrobiaceae bacterium USS-CC1]|uniref:Galactose-1-phosphate uridylyltransferase n=1 Tax=Acidiferrimicrobium australe TaxID=2664430 RepID=A0ABW9QRB6_9ACTN|nr:galactose-1-phosphate uridylyltransferase [Acidiferrimicrobium australe]
MTERRYDPTTDEWVTFATHRQNRTYKPAEFCPLCPTLPGAEPTEIPYPSFEVVTFDNLFPSFSPHPPEPEVGTSELYPVAVAAGRCEVVVYSDDHSVTFADLLDDRVRMLVDVWADRTEVLGEEPTVAYVMPFENKGETVGTTLSHPHGQIYGYPEIPPRARRELQAAHSHRDRTGRCVHCDVVGFELRERRRVVAADRGWVAWVPFWARFPYEVHIAPVRHRSSLPELDDDEREGLAVMLATVARTYDRLWGFSLPYVMAFHQLPTDGDADDWRPLSHLHVEFAPPNRAPDRLKYLAGSELAGGAFVTDVAPERAASELRAARSGR